MKGLRRQLMNRIEMKRQQIRRNESERVDVDAEKRRINAKIKVSCTKKCHLLRQQVSGANVIDIDIRLT